MKLYKFDPETMAYIGSVEAELDAWQTEVAGRECYKGQANAVWDEPPEKEGHTAYMTIDGWELRADPTLEEVKAAKVAELKEKRDAEEVEPIAYGGNNYDYDDKARDRINAAIIALDVQGEGASIEWTTADNTNVSVTAADLRGVIAAVAVRSNALHVKYRELKEAVEGCTDKAGVEAVAWA